MNRGLVSHEARLSGENHPFQPMLLTMVQNSKALRELHQSIVRKAKGLKITPNLYDRNRLMAELAEEKKRFMVIMRTAGTKESFKTDRVLPKPPPSRELYGRVVVRKRVLDVGSGDGKRLLELAARVDLTTVDRTVTSTLLASPHYHMDYRQVPGVFDLYLSFNVLTQEPSITAAGEGMHIYPDIKQFEAWGLSREQAGVYVTQSRYNTYRDYVVERPSVDYGGYRGTNVYREDEVAVAVGPVEGVAPEFAHLGRRIDGSDEVDQVLSDPDVTAKYDGELALLMIGAGAALLSFRHGGSMEGEATEGVELKAYLEVLQERFVLLSVEYYKEWNGRHPL